MNISLSNLKLVNLFIDSCSFNFIPLKEEISDDKALDDCDLDLNFDIKQHDNNLYLIFLTIIGNEKKDIPGYTFEVTGVGLFELINETDKKIIDSYLLNSALPMLIAHLRAFIIDITNRMALGRYILPAIDLTKFIKDKKEIDQAKVSTEMIKKDESPKE